MNAPTTVKTAAKKWQCRNATQHDEDRLIALFLAAFGHTIPKELWAWKYAVQREKQGILAETAEKPIAYYGGIPRTLWRQNESIHAIQVCDVMVSPEMRGILTRNGALRDVAYMFIDTLTGHGKTYQLSFGLPSGRHARLGEKIGLYSRVDTLTEATWQAATSLYTRTMLKMRPLTESDNDIMNQLWQTMRQSLPDYMLPQKNADFFTWRYLQHPCYSYIAQVVSRRWSNQAAGIFVLRDHGPENGCELMDLLGPPSSLPLLLQAAQHFVAQKRYQSLYAWLTPNVLAALPKPTKQSEITGVYIATANLKEMIAQDQTQLPWWLMGGDTDFR